MTNVPTTHEDQTPLPMRPAHTHGWECEWELDDPTIIVKDCICGARAIVRVHPDNHLELLRFTEAGDAGTSFTSALYDISEEQPLLCLIRP